MKAEFISLYLSLNLQKCSQEFLLVFYLIYMESWWWESSGCFFYILASPVNEKKVSTIFLFKCLDKRIMTTYTNAHQNNRLGMPHIFAPSLSRRCLIPFCKYFSLPFSLFFFDNSRQISRHKKSSEKRLKKYRIIF